MFQPILTCRYIIVSIKSNAQHLFGEKKSENRLDKVNCSISSQVTMHCALWRFSQKTFFFFYFFFSHKGGDQRASARRRTQSSTRSYVTLTKGSCNV